jgi:RNA 3'-terminal phosphate cyclase (ATP)
MELVEIDGSLGEGGGQILRSSLALSLVTGRPFRIRRLRAGREKPGLLRQHLTAVQAAANVGTARVEGDFIGSQEVSFAPASVRPGSYRFAVGTAGSATLVLQTVLPALMIASAPSELVLEGGTHNPFAPPFDFLDRVLLPILGRMGPRITARLERPGFYPAGGGRFRVAVEPSPSLEGLALLERGDILRRHACARVSNLPRDIAEREVTIVRTGLSWMPEWLQVEEIRNAAGPGNILTVEIESEKIRELFTGFGRREATAESVAAEVVREVREYLASGSPVGPHLADQLLVPMAIAGEGAFRTVSPTRHTLTNAEILRMFLDVEVEVRREASSKWLVSIRRPGRDAEIR